MSSHASMNRIYRLVFNAATGMYVAVAETARGRGKAGRSASAAMLAALTAVGGVGGVSGAADSFVCRRLLCRRWRLGCSPDAGATALRRG